MQLSTLSLINIYQYLKDLETILGKNYWKSDTFLHAVRKTKLPFYLEIYIIYTIILFKYIIYCTMSDREQEKQAHNQKNTKTNTVQ